MSLAIKAAKIEYMGDPGLFGSIWKGIKGVGRAAAGIVGAAGIPVVSPVARIAGGILGGQAPVAPPPTYAPLPERRAADLYRGRTGAIAQRLRAPGVGLAPAPGILPGVMQPACQAGYRPNKTSYFLRDGTFVPRGSKCVKIRRRNPGNMRAADRAIGRIESSKKAMARLNRVTVRKKCS